MGLLNRKPRPPHGTARIEFYGDEVGELVAMFPVWEGDDMWLPHLPAAAFDDHLAFIRFEKQREPALQDLRRRVDIALEDPGSDEWLYGIPVVDEAPRLRLDGVVMTELRMDYEAQRLWTKSREEPEVHRALLFTLTPEVYWDWVFGAIRDSNVDLLINLMTNLRYQCDYYAVHGIAADFRLKNVGRASFFGSMSGARDRLQAQIAAVAGITIDEFNNLPDDERALVTAEFSAQDDSFGEVMKAWLDRQPGMNDTDR